jgi:hypothetical protein
VAVISGDNLEPQKSFMKKREEIATNNLSRFEKVLTWDNL